MPTRDGQHFIQCILGQIALRMVLQEIGQRVMDKIATKRRIDRPVDIIKLPEAKHPFRIKAVGIGNPVINLGGGKAPRTRTDRWRRARAGAGRHRRHGQQRDKLVTPTLAIINRLLDAQRTKHRAKTLQPAARRRHRIAITKRPGDDHLRRGGGHPHIMRAEPGPPVMRLQAGGLPHFGIHPGIDFRAWWPVALIEAAKDQPVGTLHPCLDRSENGQAGMRLPAAPHGF